MEALDAELHEDLPPAPKPRRSTFNTFKPGPRQPAPKPAVATGEPPWWAKVKPGEMTKAAEAEQARMRSSKIGMRLGSVIHE